MKNRGGLLALMAGAVVAGLYQPNPAEAIPTTTAVTRVNPQGENNITPFATSVFGQPVVVTATVTAASGGLAPLGSVVIQTFGAMCNATLAPQNGLVATATCTLPPPVIAGGPFLVFGSYQGTPTFEASSSSESGANGEIT